MPVLDLDDFLKKNASQKTGEPQAAGSPGLAAKPASQSPFAAFTGSSQQDATNAVAGDLLDFRQRTEGALTSIGQDFLKLSGRVSTLERNTGASQAKTEQLIAIIDRIQPDKISSEITDIRSQLSSLKPPSAAGMQDVGGGVRVSGPDVSGSVRRLETEYVEMSSRLRPMEVALEQLKAWADRDKDYFIKTDEAHNKLSELERKIALKSDYPSEQIMSRAQFEKYSKMADMDRQQLRLSIDSLRDTVSQVSVSVDRLNSMAAGGHAFYPGQGATGLDAKVEAHERAIAELRASSGAEGLDKYSKELEKTRAEVSANYEQVKAVERLLTAQSNKMQAVFSEIQKNLSEYKLTSDTINSTHEAVLRDISSLKAEHEHGIDDYRKIASELSQKVEQNAHAVAEMHLMINGLQYAATKAGGARPGNGEPMQDSNHVRAEQKRLLDETDALSATVSDLARKAASFQAQSARIASVEEAVLRIERKVNDSDANNAALFANVTTGFSELKRRIGAAAGSPADADPARVAVVEKGFADLGEKVNSLERENASLFSNLSKSVSNLKAQVDSLQTASPASHEMTSSADGRVTFAVSAPSAAPSPDGTLLSRIDALEKSISSLHLPSQADAASASLAFSAAPGSANDSLRLFENKFAYIESFKTELDQWKEKADDLSEKVGSLYSSHAQLVQEVASVISEKQSDAYAEEKFSQAQAEESKTLLNELAVRTEMLSSKLAATEGNVSAIVGQRFSQLQAQSDRLNADLSGLKAALPERLDLIAASEERQAKALAAVDAKLSQAADERFSKAQQATSQQALEFAVFRDAMPEKTRLAVAAAESRQADATAAVDAKVAKLSTESDKLRDFVGKAVAEAEKSTQESRTTLNEIRARSDELAAKITGFSSSQAQFVQDLSGTIEDKFAEAQQSIESTAAAMSGKVAQFEAGQADTLAGFEASQLQMLKQFEDKQAGATTAFESQQSKLVSEFESKISSSVNAFEATQSQMLASFEAKQAQAFSALDTKQAEAMNALDKRQADLAAALEVRESQTTSAIDALRVGVEAQKSDSEKLTTSMTKRMDTLDAFSRSISELLSTTKAEVAAEVAGVRKVQDTEFASIHQTQAVLSKSLQDTDARISAAVSDGLARSAASVQELSDRSAASIAQLAARSASSTEQLTASITQTSKAVESLHSTIDARERLQDQEIAAVRASNALLEQKVSGLLVVLEKVAALSRELDTERTEVRNTVKELRAAFNEQAVAQVTEAQRQLAQAPASEPQSDATARQAALEVNLSDLERAIAEIESKMPAAPSQQAAPAQQSQFTQQPTQYAPQPRVQPTQQQAPQYAQQPRVQPAQPQPRPQAPQYAQPQQRPRQEYYAPQAEQQARSEPARTMSSSIRPIQRPAPRPTAPQYRDTSRMGPEAGESSAQTEADKQAMDLMAELRGKLLGDEAPKTEKKDAKPADEKEQQN